MRGLLTLLGLALVIFLSVGYYRGWYTISKSPSSDPGHSRIEFDINTGKINQDVNAGAKRIGEVINKTPTAAPTAQQK
jgi:hypothetical protein